jgi:hypothetical protein
VALQRREAQLSHSGVYGELVDTDWKREKKHFYKNVLDPELFARGVNLDFKTYYGRYSAKIDGGTGPSGTGRY